jgi:AraC-like DNA-binding protein
MFLEHVLDGLDVTFGPLIISDARHGWAGHGRDDAPSVRHTAEGEAILTLVGGVDLCARPDRVAVLPSHLRGHTFPDGRPAPMNARARTARAWHSGVRGAAESDGLVARGRIRVTYLGSVGLFDRLREPVVEQLTGDDPLWRGFKDLVDEIAGQRPGYRAMAEAMLRRCLIDLLRRQHDRNSLGLLWLTPLEDSRLGRAVSAMQDRPEQSFTLPTLAAVAGMSRSVFAARFADMLGQSPIGFLKTLRLARATRLLLVTDLPVKTVADRVGYSSRSSFTRAFAACHGVGPLAFRSGARKPHASWSERMDAGAPRET